MCGENGRSDFNRSGTAGDFHPIQTILCSGDKITNYYSDYQINRHDYAFIGAGME